MLGYDYALYLKGKTLKEITEDLDLPANLLSKVLRGKIKIPLSGVVQITEYFNVPISLLEKEMTVESRHQIDTLMHLPKNQFDLEGELQKSSKKDTKKAKNSNNETEDKNSILNSLQGIIIDLEQKNQILVEELKVYAESPTVNKELANNNRDLVARVHDLEKGVKNLRNKNEYLIRELNTERTKLNAYRNTVVRSLRQLENISVSMKTTLVENRVKIK